jgi:uncharacterized OB-fold protein
MLNEHPVPLVTPWTEQQFAHARNGELALQQCSSCQEIWFPPSTNCPNCLGESWEWVTASGRGTLWSWIVMHQPYLASFRDETPYVVAAVQLAEGPLMMSTVVGTAPADLEFDSPLQVEFQEFGPEGLPMPVFRVAA